MPSDLLFIPMLISVLVFCGITTYIYKTWTRDSDQAHLAQQALERVKADFSNARIGLDQKKNEHVQLEKRLSELQQKLDTSTQERNSDRTAYQSLFDKIETQMHEKEAELAERNKEIAQLKAAIATHQAEIDHAVPEEPTVPPEAPTTRPPGPGPAEDTSEEAHSAS